MHRVIDRILLRQKIESQGNKIFRVDFYKKDGTPRRMNCRLHVKTPLKGGRNNVEPNHPNLKVVYDLKSKGYRTINLDTIYACSLNGEEYKVNNKLTDAEVSDLSIKDGMERLGALIDNFEWRT